MTDPFALWQIPWPLDPWACPWPNVHHNSTGCDVQIIHWKFQLKMSACRSSTVLHHLLHRMDFQNAFRLWTGTRHFLLSLSYFLIIVQEICRKLLSGLSLVSKPGGRVCGLLQILLESFLSKSAHRTRLISLNDADPQPAARRPGRPSRGKSTHKRKDMFWLDGKST